MFEDILYEDARWKALDLDQIAKTAAEVTADHLGLSPGLTAALLACDDTRIAELNAEFRGKSTPTNVLSWPSEERAANEPGGRPAASDDPELGDIAIAWETCEREATEAGKSMADHVTHLIVHGLLHLLGYDHENDADADLMEVTEVAILAKLGLDDPYS